MALNPTAQYEKELLATRYWLLGREYHTALAAMEFARGFHTGLRKDKVTPNFAHQIFIFNYLKTLLSGITHKEATLAVAFLHDVCEDHHIGFEEIERRFGDQVAHSTKLLTKKFCGQVIPYPTYFALMAEDPIASLVKGTDRGHNILTMSAAGWTPEKQTNYLEDVQQWFLPMLKLARRNFPEQEPVYENIKSLLTIQSAHIRLNLEQIKTYQAIMSPEETSIKGM